MGYHCGRELQQLRSLQWGVTSNGGQYNHFPVIEISLTSSPYDLLTLTR